jgi:hypothetical protein
VVPTKHDCGLIDFFDVEFDPCLQFAGGGVSDARNRVFAIFAKKDSIKFSQNPCLGVRVNSNRFGSVVGKARVSLEIWAQ